MKCYLAPMEGITGYIYRNAYHHMFYPMDKYFTPFLVPNQNWKLKSKELNDVLPEHNEGLNVIPQILTGSEKDFIWIADVLQQFGYHEINLNLGCPSKTVVTKGKGSGFLSRKEELDHFFDSVFSETTIELSVKTRIGMESPEEFYELLDIYNKYPLKELIIHPRIQTDYYNNKPNFDIFEYGLKNSKNPICYNGNIFTEDDYQQLTRRFEHVDRIMFGRGVIADPGLLQKIFGEKGPQVAKLREFHDKICSDYRLIMSGDHNVLFRMKELWDYLGWQFADAQKQIKKIKKTKNLQDYMALTDALFSECF